MSPDTFRTLIAGVTHRIEARPLDQDLADWLNAEYPASGAAWAELADACCTGVKEGWLCEREAGGIRYGRIFKALPEDDPKMRNPDIGLAESRLGWRPKVPFEQGAARTIEYFRKYTS